MLYNEKKSFIERNLKRDPPGLEAFPGVDTRRILDYVGSSVGLNRVETTSKPVFEWTITFQEQLGCPGFLRFMARTSA